MSRIIPGVPTPRTGDPTCVLSTCARIIAQVDCVLNVLQGATGCIEIQLFNKEGKPLDLDRFSEMHVMLYDELECVVANFFWPNVPTGCTGHLIEILQRTTSTGTIVDKGLIKVCLSKECTSRSPGKIFAEIRLTEPATETGGTDDIIGVKCIWVAQILESLIYKNGCDDGC